MAFVLFGSDLCDDCVEFKQLLQDRNVEYIYRNITNELTALKEFLKLRDNDSAFIAIKEKGSIGIPCFVVNNNLIFTPEELDKIL